MQNKGYTWDLVQTKQKWPWHETYGPNQLITIYKDGKPVISISTSQVMDSLGFKFVNEHVQTYLKPKHEKIIKDISEYLEQ